MVIYQITYELNNIYDGDRLLITAIKGDYHGWVTKDFWEWLDERL